MNDFRKSNPLADAVKGVMVENNRLRGVEAQVNKELGVYSRNAMPSERLGEYDRRLAEAQSDKKNLTEEVVEEEKKPTYWKGNSHIEEFPPEDDGFDWKTAKLVRKEPATLAKKTPEVAPHLKEGKKDESWAAGTKRRERVFDKIKHKIPSREAIEAARKKREVAPHLKEDPITYAQVMEEIKRNLGEEALQEAGFGDAFKAARQSGKTEFEFGGKKFNTMQKGEDKTKWAAEMAAQQKRAADAVAPVPAVRGATVKQGDLPPAKPNPANSTPVAKPALNAVRPAAPTTPLPAKPTLNQTSNAVLGTNRPVDLAPPARLDTPAAQPISVPAVSPEKAAIEKQVNDKVKDVKTNLDASTKNMQDYFKESTTPKAKRPYRTMTSLVEGIQNREYLNEAKTD